VQLHSNNPALAVPAAVQVEDGRASAQFTVRSQTSDQDTTATIIAADEESGQSTPVSVVGIRPDSLSCLPKVVPAGGQAVCELRLNSSAIATSLNLDLASSSETLRLPARVRTRPLQATLTFVAAADPAAGDQSVTISARFGANQAQDTITIQGGTAPVLTAPERQLSAAGAPVAFTVSAVDPAGSAVQLTAANLPAGASFDAASGRFEWTPAEDQRGSYDLTFSGTNSQNTSASRHVSVEVDSGAPAITDLANTATKSKEEVCSAGGMATLTGKRLASSDRPWADDSGAVTELGGVKVLVNGAPVPVLYTAAGKVNFLCPAVPSGSPLHVSVENAAGRFDAPDGMERTATPGIFSIDGSGAGQAAVTFAGTGDVAAVRSYRVQGQPAQPGDQLSILATGIGAAADPSTGLRAVVKIGGLSADVESIGPSSSAGVYELRFTLPAAVPAEDEVPLTIQVAQPDGQVIESNRVTIAVEAVRP
jgi:uncharacterized protein (TIGR03437 family)